MAKPPPPPPERPRSRRGGSLSLRGRGAQRRRHGPAGRRGSCQLDPSCERVEEWGAGQRERQEGATRSVQESAPQRLAAASAVSCPPALHSPRLSLGHRAPKRSAACKSERSRPPLRRLHTPRYITRDREEPAAASALPRLGPPRPRAHPAPGPAPRPLAARSPSAEPRRGSPSHMAVAAASSPPRTSLRGSRPLPWGVPASACQTGRSAVPRPSSFGRPLLACPRLVTFVNQGALGGPACDQALRKTALQAGGTKRRTSAARQRACRFSTGVGKEPRRRSKTGSNFES